MENSQEITVMQDTALVIEAVEDFTTDQNEDKTKGERWLIKGGASIFLHFHIIFF